MDFKCNVFSSFRHETIQSDLFFLFDESQQPDLAHAGVQCVAQDNAHPFKLVIGRTR